MNPGRALATLLARLVASSAQGLLLRGVAAAAAGGLLALIPAVGGTVNPALWLTVLLVTVAAVALPDSAVPLAALLGLAFLWAISVPDLLSAWTVLAGVLLLAVHLGCALTSYGPPELVLPGALLLAWARRAGVAAAVTVLVWVAARSLSGLALGGGLPGTVAALLLVTASTGYLGTRLVRPRGSAAP